MSAPLEYTALHVEAALCIWEHMLDTRESDPPLDTAWTNTGTATMRDTARSLGPWVCDVYDLIPPDVTDLHAYDWEVVPAIMRTGRWWPAGGFSHPDADVAADLVAAELEAEKARWTAAGGPA